MAAPRTHSVGKAGLWGPLGVGWWDEAQAQLEPCKGDRAAEFRGRGEDVGPTPQRHVAGLT